MSHIRDLVMNSLDLVFIHSSAHHIEYIIQPITSMSTDNNQAINVKYLSIFHMIFIIDEKPGVILHRYIPY